MSDKQIRLEIHVDFVFLIVAEPFIKMNKLFGLIALIADACLLSGCVNIGQIGIVKTEEVRHKRLNLADKMFEQHCALAGEKIYKRVENVEGIFLLKLRPEKINFSDQYLLDDPYGSDFGGGCIYRKFFAWILRS